MLTRPGGVVASVLDKLTSLGTVQLVNGKPSIYRLAPATASDAEAAGDPGTSAEPVASAMQRPARAGGAAEVTIPSAPPAALGRCIRALTCAGASQVHERGIEGAIAPSLL